MTNPKGRGAISNDLSQRFGLAARAPDGDWLDWAAADGGLPPLRTTVAVEQPKSALSRNDSPDIPFEQSFNAYRGCEHGCIYCFARPSHAWHDLSPGLDFETRLFAKPTGPDLLRQEFARQSYRPQVLAMGTNTDPYQPIERDWHITRRVLALCLETRHPLSITTKSGNVLRDLDLLAELASLRLASVTLSVTTLDPTLARAMEPRAAAPHRRLATIRALATAGVPCFVSASPMIPALNDHELEAILQAAAGAGASGAYAQMLRLPHEVASLFEAWLRRHYPDRAGHVLSAIRAARGGRLNEARFHQRMRPDSEWGRLLAQRLHIARLRFGLGGKAPSLRTDLFRRPAVDSTQGDLFALQ